MQIIFMPDTDVSPSCAPLGDGICDGYYEVEEGGEPLWCTCECHDADDLPNTTDGVRDWHDAAWSEQSTTLAVNIALNRKMGTNL